MTSRILKSEKDDGMRKGLQETVRNKSTTFVQFSISELYTGASEGSCRSDKANFAATCELHKVPWLL